MRLLLHAGTEKTGSSHIQTKCVFARDDLQAQCVWFPVGLARHESRMRVGLVSAGNGYLLSKHLAKADLAAAFDLLRGYGDAAAKAGCHTVFLTSELLLPALSKSRVMNAFLAQGHRAGFAECSVLLVLRDPVDQCLSLYKHRAKGGGLADIGTWLDDGYRLPSELAGFREQLAGCELDLRVRRYSRAPGALEQLFFVDWLGVPVPPVDVPATVNASLTLSELALIRQLSLCRPALIEPMFDALAKLPAADKARHGRLEDYARAMAAAAVSAHADEWAAWNERLPAGESLSLPDPPDTLPQRPDEVVFSERQLAAIAAVNAQAATLGFLGHSFWRRRLRPALARVARPFRDGS